MLPSMAPLGSPRGSDPLGGEGAERGDGAHGTKHRAVDRVLLEESTRDLGTRVRVERFAAYAELRPRGGYRRSGSSTLRVHSHRLVVIVEERKVAADALEPSRPPAPPPKVHPEGRSSEGGWPTAELEALQCGRCSKLPRSIRMGPVERDTVAVCKVPR